MTNEIREPTGVAGWATTVQPFTPVADRDELVERALGRARFCRHRGEIKTPEIIEELAARIQSDAAIIERMRERDENLRAIAGIIRHWIKHTMGEDRSGDVTADTHVMLSGYDGAPPHWPSVGQLKLWVEVLAASL